MSKENLVSSNSESNISNRLINLYKDVNRVYLPHLQGQVLTLIDALGLPEIQAKAVKDTIKNDFKDTRASLVDRFSDNYNQLIVEELKLTLDYIPTIIDLGGDSHRRPELEEMSV